MFEFLAEYGLFLAKAITIVVAILLIISAAVASGMKSVKEQNGHITITHLNEKIDVMRDTLKMAVMDKEAVKLDHKAEKKRLKLQQKQNKKALKAKKAKKVTANKVTDSGDTAEGADAERKKRVYVINFDGDVKASAVDSLKHEITAILSMATAQDEVLLCLESAGGMVHSYGLASSQLYRIKQKEVPLTICVDKVAASGGYMMACLADKLVAAPFAILGSIGVIAQIPNFHRLLKKNYVDFEMVTAGEYKRTLTMFGENSAKDREKMRADIEDVHGLFKDHVKQHRAQLDVEAVATGETWFGVEALDKKMIDEIKTSDECIVSACDEADVYEVCYEEKKTFSDKISSLLSGTADKILLNWMQRSQNSRFYS